MENAKIVIAAKLAARRETYALKKDDVLISVAKGCVTDVIRGVGKYPLDRTDDTNWYVVDCGENIYGLSYQGGGIQFTFSFAAAVAFPTRTIQAKAVVGKDMTTLIQDWAASASVSDTIATALKKLNVTTEKQLFDSSCCELLEREIAVAYQEHFIKEWGMFLNAVRIKKKMTVQSKSTTGKNPYDYIL
jgi:hypothetical protein